LRTPNAGGSVAGQIATSSPPLEKTPVPFRRADPCAHCGDSFSVCQGGIARGHSDSLIRSRRKKSDRPKGGGGDLWQLIVGRKPSVKITRRPKHNNMNGVYSVGAMPLLPFSVVVTHGFPAASSRHRRRPVQRRGSRSRTTTPTRCARRWPNAAPGRTSRPKPIARTQPTPSARHDEKQEGPSVLSRLLAVPEARRKSRRCDSWRVRAKPGDATIALAGTRLVDASQP
jgi:hypothetical protein